MLHSAGASEVRRDGRGAFQPRPQRAPRRPAAPRDADAPARHRPHDARRRLRRGREGPRGRGGRRGRRRLGRPRDPYRGRLRRLRRRHRDAGPDGRRRPPRPHPRPARQDAEPEDRHRDDGRRQGGRRTRRAASSSTAPTAARTCTCRSGSAASTRRQLLENYATLVDEIVRAKPAVRQGPLHPRRHARRARWAPGSTSTPRGRAGSSRSSRATVPEHRRRKLL